MIKKVLSIILFHFLSLFSYKSFCQNAELDDLYKKCKFFMSISCEVTANDDTSNVMVSIVDSGSYHKDYILKKENKKKNIWSNGVGKFLVVPFGRIYTLKVYRKGCDSKSVILNLKDNLSAEDLKKLKYKKVPKFFNAKKANSDTSSASTSSDSYIFFIRFQLMQLTSLPLEIRENAYIEEPLAEIIFNPKKKKFEFNDKFSTKLIQERKSLYKKSEIFLENPDLKKDFSKMSDSLKLKELILSKQREELLKEILLLVEKQNQNAALVSERILKEIQISEQKAIAISRQKELDLTNQLRINQEQKAEKLALIRDNEQKQYLEQKRQNELIINEQKLLARSKQKELELLNQEKKTKQLEAENATYAKNALLAISAFIAIVSLLLLRAYFIKRKSNKELHHQKELITTQNREILDSIEYAKRIQATILPPPKVVKKYLDDSFILYLPKDIVAGDFYWMESVGDWVLFAACDCTGHGVPGALVSVVCHNALNRAVKEYNKIMPAEILDVVAELVLENFSTDDDVKDGMDASVCALNTATGELYWAGANNPLWLIRHDELDSTSAEIIGFKPNKQPIGKFDDRVPYTNHKIEIAKGDTIYLFTDGYADQFGGERGKKLTKAKFKEAILNMQRINLDEQKKYLLDLHLNYKGSLGQVDDICVIGVRV